MTTHLKDTVLRLARLGGLPMPPRERMTRTEKVSAGLAAHGDALGVRPERDESWGAVADRIDFSDLSAARPRDIRRAINDIWEDGDRDAVAAPLVAHSLAEGRKTFDRELVLAYLRRFPLEHPAFEALSEAAGTAAERHDWPWRERGRRFSLWDADEGPARLGDALLRADQPLGLLREAGLDGDLAAGVFLEEALDDVCEQVGEACGEEAEDLGRRLVALFEGLQVGGSDAMLAYALLNPWRDRSPSEAHRKAIGGMLVRRIGDPRFAQARWTALLAELARHMPNVDATALAATLRRWLTDATVKAFFRIIGRTTDRKDQWDAREAFWLGYLNTGVILDAWFAFGRRAEALAGAMAKEESVQFARVSGGADPSHSSLIMSIGDVRIAEWSHDGSCRFWASASRRAPKLYEPEYDGTLLRTTSGPPGFAYRGHRGPWELKFAHEVYRRTGVRHPVHGAGNP